MKRIIAIIAALSLAGCATVQRITPEQAAVVVGTVIVTGAVLSLSHGHQREPVTFGPPASLPCHPQPNGTCR